MIGGKWVGFEEILRNVEALGHELATEEVLAPGLLATGRELRADIQHGAPRSGDNRHMADEFVVKLSKEESDFGRVTVLVGPRAGRGSVGFVAPFVEFGTSVQRGQPFIRPAFDAARGWFPTMFADHLRRQYQRVVRKYTKRAAA